MLLLLFALPAFAQEMPSDTNSAFWTTLLAPPQRRAAGFGALCHQDDPANAFDAVLDAWSPIQITRETNDVFKVENHFAFTDARECKFSWQLRKFSSPLATNTPFTVLREGVLDSPAIPPGSAGFVRISAASSKTADALALRADDPAGRPLWTWGFPLKFHDFHRLAEEPAEHQAVPAETNGVITITTGNLAVTFGQDTGLLLGVRRGSQSFSLTNGPRLAAGHATLRTIHFDDDGPDAFVSAKYDGDLKSVFWRVNGNGWINCDYTCAAEGTNNFLGVLFDLPEDRVRHKRWLGDGPCPVRKNGAHGAMLGVWENDCHHPNAGGRDESGPAFKGFFAGVYWLQLDTADGLITIVNNQPVPFVQVLTPESSPSPPGGLGFLNAIPGHKFGDAHPDAPPDQSDAVPGEITGSLSFYFGKLPSDF